ncbi:DUF262 domain-containing protein [Mycoplasma sp. Pen4]|uniref:DUF262 domain-containing protein n=1 Tax=Mycoplasma sp. Pen4 TaxID=640330 RepID=UPI001654AB82|nr:DUF262 domain-containing protein [Mycoplasma sp. Pen4]QNM93785.1 DUF262 domain-containing protein [Mycoplasma sp. Pen4]
MKEGKMDTRMITKGNVEPTNLANLFTVEGKEDYYIPTYQRNYVWGKDAINSLFNDLKSIVSFNDDNNFNEHFLGVILMYSPGEEYGRYPKYLIDGQQRITTLTLMLMALRNLMLKESEKTAQINEICENINKRFKNSSEKSVTLIDDEKNSTSSESSLKQIILSNTTYIDELHKKLGIDGSKIDKNKNINNIELAYKTIYNKLKSYKLELKNKDIAPEIWFEKVKDAILNQMIFVKINFNNNNQTTSFQHKVFESLNNNGVKLEEYDLIHNYLERLYSQEKFDARNDKDIKKELDKAIEEYRKFWNDDIIGKMNQSEITEFFKTLLEKETYDLVNKKTYYKTFKETEIVKNNGFIKVFNWIKRNFVLYTKCLNVAYGKKGSLDRELYFYNLLNRKNSLPIIMTIYEKVKETDDKSKETEELKKIVKIINTYTMRKTAAGHNSKSENNLFISIYKKMFGPNKMFDNDKWYDQLIQLLIEENKSESSRMPEDSEIRDRFKSRNYYGTEWLKQFFNYVINYNETGVNPVDISLYTFEHWIPQSKRRNSDNQEEIKAIDLIGNLFIFNKEDNSKLSNASDEDKKDMLNQLQKQVNFKVNELALNEKIDAKKVDERCVDLFNEYFLKFFEDPRRKLNTFQDKKIKNNTKPSEKNVSSDYPKASITKVLKDKDFWNEKLKNRVAFDYKNQNSSKQTYAEITFGEFGDIILLKGSKIVKTFEYKNPHDDVVELRNTIKTEVSSENNEILITQENATFEFISHLYEFVNSAYESHNERWKFKDNEKYIDEEYVEWKLEKESQ